MKIALAQINTIPCDLTGNLEKIEQACLEAHQGGASLVVFCDGALSGAPLYDVALGQEFREQVAEHLDLLAQRTKDLIEVVICGTETFENGSVAHLSQGKITYADHSDIVTHRSQRFKIYPFSNIFSHNSPQVMLELMGSIQKLSDIPLIYVNQVGASTETIWPGGSIAIWNKGQNVVRLPLFEQAIEVIEIADNQENKSAKWGDKTAQTHQALVMGIKDYFFKNGFSQACVALSGGIDSAVVVALAVQALGSDRVRVIMLPSPYSSSHSVDDSVDMANRCGIRADKVLIGPILEQAEKAMATVLDGSVCGLAHENMQSRIRLMLTMTLSNQTGALMLNTSNKSEIAVGYGTLYGDTSGALGVIADLYKCEVYDLARHINATYRDIIPENIITKEPSAELRADQRDSDSLPPYPTLDKVLHMLIEQRMTVRQILLCDTLTAEQKAEVPRIARLLWRGDFKRQQLPPPLRVSGATFNHERTMPITKGSFGL